MNKKLVLKRFLTIALPIIVVFLTADLVSKYLIDGGLEVGESVKFLPGFIDIVIVHNDGSAWGLFAGFQIFLIVLTFLFLLALVWYTLAEKIQHPLYHVAIGFVVAGCLGNLFDRIAFGYVRDFLHFEFMPNFPVFNIADVCLTVGVLLFVAYVIVEIVKYYKKKKEDGKTE